MGIFESSTLSLTNLEPTTWTLSGSQVELTTSLGITTTAGAIYAIDEDKDVNKYVNPKKLAILLGVGLGSTTLSSSINLQSVFAEEYHTQAETMGITVEQEQAVNETRNIEEWFESLSDEEQLQLLSSIDEKKQALEKEQTIEKVATKHL